MLANDISSYLFYLCTATILVMMLSLLVTARILVSPAVSALLDLCRNQQEETLKI